MTAGNEIVQVTDVVKDFRPGFGLRSKRVLHGISFGVMPGEIFGFVGPNGAGKTTTLKVLMGLIRATSGTATILGHDIKETEFRKEIGFLPENAYFYDYLTGREMLDFYARLSGVPKARRTERVATLLEWVGLTDAADQRIRSYSKGMAQRVGIAQALVHDPSVVFLDEPMSGLDPIGRKEIRDLIIRLRAEGKTVFMNTHILSDVEMVCDRVAIIVAGKIMYQGRTEEILNDGEHMSEVVVSGVSPETAARLEEEFGAELRGVGERVEMRVKEKNVDAILASVLGSKGRVMSVTPQRVSLENIFMDAVRGDGQ
ncbi:MAG: ABC-2 type transport system ATP-binding protein [Myxococcota bacterium]|jgi:ABC-2 type transport system ATP-binding protein